MTNLIDLQLPNHKLYAIGVPGNAHSFEEDLWANREIGALQYTLNKENEFIHAGFDFKILGYITKEHISFDCACLYNILPQQLYSALQSKEAYFENSNPEPPSFFDFEDLYKSVDKDSGVEMWYSECKRYQNAQQKVHPKYIIIEKI